MEIVPDLSHAPSYRPGGEGAEYVSNQMHAHFDTLKMSSNPSGEYALATRLILPHVLSGLREFSVSIVSAVPVDRVQRDELPGCDEPRCFAANDLIEVARRKSVRRAPAGQRIPADLLAGADRAGSD